MSERADVKCYNNAIWWLLWFFFVCVCTLLTLLSVTYENYKGNGEIVRWICSCGIDSDSPSQNHKLVEVGMDL